MIISIYAHIKKLKCSVESEQTNSKKTRMYQIRKIRIGVITFLFCAVFWTNQLVAQSYIQTRVGYVTGRYKALDKNVLDRDEHDFLGGAMFDIEYGRRLGNEKISFLIGGRLQYSLRVLEGTYSANIWEPDADIKAHIPSIFLTIGGRAKIINKFNLLLQANIGPSYVLWYQDGKHTNSFWKFYLPIDTGIEYEFKDDWSLVGGVTVTPPIYLSTTVNYFFGLRKEF